MRTKKKGNSIIITGLPRTGISIDELCDSKRIVITGNTFTMTKKPKNQRKKKA